MSYQQESLHTHY